ncbi:hypothetical protein RFI_35440, partial [Reticulomyxa filosa]
KKKKKKDIAKKKTKKQKKQKKTTTTYDGYGVVSIEIINNNKSCYTWYPYINTTTPQATEELFDSRYYVCANGSLSPSYSLRFVFWYKGLLFKNKTKQNIIFFFFNKKKREWIDAAQSKDIPMNDLHNDSVYITQSSSGHCLQSDETNNITYFEWTYLQISLYMYIYIYIYIYNYLSYLCSNASIYCCCCHY